MSEIRRILVGKIIITGDNPRQDFNLESIKRLGESIINHGLIQPIVVRPKEDYYEGYGSKYLVSFHYRIS